MVKKKTHAEFQSGIWKDNIKMFLRYKMSDTNNSLLSRVLAYVSHPRKIIYIPNDSLSTQNKLHDHRRPNKGQADAEGRLQWYDRRPTVWSG